MLHSLSPNTVRDSWNRAAAPSPSESATPASPLPATVLTAPAIVTRRTARFLELATRTPSSASSASSRGQEKRAAAPCPSAKPGSPLPASVVVRHRLSENVRAARHRLLENVRAAAAGPVQPRVSSRPFSPVGRHAGCWQHAGSPRLGAPEPRVGAAEQTPADGAIRQAERCRWHAAGQSPAAARGHAALCGLHKGSKLTYKEQKPMGLI